MEGTTNTTGAINGATSDPGMLSGGVKNILLSDRWFTWEYPIEAEIGLSSSTALVQEVKRLMVDRSKELQMPSRPIEPKVPEEDVVPIEYAEYILYVILMVLIAKFFNGTVNENTFGITIIFIFVVIGLVFWARKATKNHRLEKKKAKGAMPVYLAQLDEYETKKNAVIKAREQLWEQARICMRCGTAYLGNN